MQITNTIIIPTSIKFQCSTEIIFYTVYVTSSEYISDSSKEEFISILYKNHNITAKNISFEYLHCAIKVDTEEEATALAISLKMMYI